MAEQQVSAAREHCKALTEENSPQKIIYRAIILQIKRVSN
jgi:hypothetical protein